MATDKQIAANRANAKRSTGPRTPEGRLKSSQNARKHGILAGAILIEGESQEEFLKLCQAYDAEYNPQTPTEQALVNKAVTAQWRALRAATFETAAIRHEMHRQSQSACSDSAFSESAPNKSAPNGSAGKEDKATQAMLAVRVLHESSAHMERLSLYEHRFDVQHRHAIRDLIRRRGEKRNWNKRTQFDEADKELIAPDPSAKANCKPSKAA